MSSNHRIILVGSEVQWTQKALPVGACVDTVGTWQEALPVLEKQLDNDSLFWLKALTGPGCIS
jgi:hypothetical protein